MAKGLEQGLRQELKFVIPAEDRCRALHWIRNSDACFYREYPERQVNNIYFDSYDLDSYLDNLSGTTSRKKTRYRWYGPSSTPVSGALELKYKRNYLNWKWAHNINEAVYVENASWNWVRRELMSRVPPDLRRHLHENPVPVLINRYQRSYFRSREDDIRVTLDTELSFYKQGRLAPNFTRKVSLKSNIVLEVKYPVHMKPRVAKLMFGFPFPVSRCSKYCVGVQAVS